LIDKIQSMFKIPELRRRILFTLALLMVFRLGSYVPVPGIDSAALSQALESARGTLLGLYDMFAGGAFSRATIFALGIMPYISASIIMQLLTAVIPYFEKLQKEGEEGRRKITQYTRYGTVFLAMIQSYGISIFLESGLGMGLQVVPTPGFAFRMLTMVSLTSGTIFLMWLGEQISDKGIGNGISLLIFAGIIARYPNDILRTFQAVRVGELKLFTLFFLLALMVLIVAGVVVMTQAMRKIPVQYAKRVIGRRIYGGQSTHIPLRVNTAGVIPIIFAQAILMFPQSIGTFFGGNVSFMRHIAELLSPRGPIYNVLYAIIIVFFAYFYTAIVFNPRDLAENMQRYGGFVPGIRPGKRTADYIDRVLTRVTLPGALFLAFIAILPSIFMYRFNAPFVFGGTGLLIVVGVALDTLQQIESHLIMRHYEGFLKKGKLRGRR
jgi:preprotein translocase subunit SecY